jgi:hypothetical protein
MKTFIIFLLSAVTAFSQTESNITASSTATQSSDYDPSFNASKAIDGNTETFSITQGSEFPYWTIDLGETNWVHTIRITPRPETRDRLTHFFVFFSNGPFQSTSTNVLVDPGVTGKRFDISWGSATFLTYDSQRLARYIRVQLITLGTASYLELAEFEVIGYPFNGPVIKLEHRPVVTDLETNYQDVLIIVGPPGLSHNIETTTNLQDPWTIFANTVSTNYSHVWYGGRTRTNGNFFYRTREVLQQ